MLLQRPDAVVAHHADHRHAVAHERVELHAREAEGAVAQQQAHLPVGVGELGRQRVARARAQAAERARVHPAAGLVGVDHAAGVGDEVAAVADHHGVAVEHLAQLVVEAQRVQRRAVVGELLLLARALLGLGLAQRGDPRRAVGAARGALAQRVERGRDAAVELQRGLARRLAVGRAPSRAARSAVSSPNEPPKPRRKSIGTPTTSATSASLRPLPRAREKASSWSAGMQPRPSPFTNTGIRSSSASARSASSPWAQ